MSKTTRLEEVARREGRVWDLTFFLTLGWIVFGALPLLAMMIVELISGSLPSAANPHPAGYPAFTGPWWAMYPLVGLQLYATALAFPLPLRGTRWGTRSTLFMQSIGVTLFTFLNGSTAYAHDGTFWGTEWLGLLSLACCAVLFVRMLLGYLRLVPRSWREYLDDTGQVVEPRDVPRARARPWDGLNRLTSRSRR